MICVMAIPITFIIYSLYYIFRKLSPPQELVAAQNFRLFVSQPHRKSPDEGTNSAVATLLPGLLQTGGEKRLQRKKRVTNPGYLKRKQASRIPTNHFIPLRCRELALFLQTLCDCTSIEVFPPMTLLDSPIRFMALSDRKPTHFPFIPFYFLPFFY